MKKIVSFVLATAMVMASATAVYAAGNTTTLTATNGVTVYDKDGEQIKTLDSGLAADVEFGTTMYLDVAELFVDQGLSVTDLNKKDLVNFSSKKTTGSKFISGISLVTEKKIGDMNNRGTYIKVDASNSLNTDEEKVKFDVTFKVRKENALKAGTVVGDTYKASITMWVSNNTVNSDVETGGKGVYTPEKNEENEIVWSDSTGDVAMVRFNAHNEAKKMYIKLSTNSVESVYKNYADKVNADVYFRDFKGTSEIPSTSRASLYLYSPWEEVDIYNVYIYTIVDGKLIDKTTEFSWVADENAWTTKTRTLGTYVISDKDLEIEEEYIGTPDDNKEVTDEVIEELPEKVVPNTGRY